MKKIPLNQTYRVKETLDQYPDLADIKYNYESWCLDQAKWGKFGRSYDCAISLHEVDFEGKKVCELGARDSIFSSYLTKTADQVFVSDLFLGWGDLGDLNHWRGLWEKFAFDKSKLTCEMQNMVRLSYPDNFFDVVMSFSTIEHIPNGDFVAAKEMGRVCKPGGKIIIGTEICPRHTFYDNCYFYDEDSLFERIIRPTGGKIGEYDFSYEKGDKTIFRGHEFTSCIFVLDKE